MLRLAPPFRPTASCNCFTARAVYDVAMVVPSGGVFLLVPAGVLVTFLAGV